MKAPKLIENKCSLLIAEYATGHVFKKDLTLFSKADDESDVYLLFNSYENAEEYAQNFIKSRPEFECHIYDQKGKYFKTYDVNGKRKMNRTTKFSTFKKLIRRIFGR